MHGNMDKKAEWHSWSTLIFWGIVALAIFGWIAGLFELFSGLVQTVQGIVCKIGEFGALGGLDGMTEIQEYLDGFNTLMSTFEFLTIASWAVYLFGLYKFRYAQTTVSAVGDVKRINNAAWVGLVAAFFVIVAGWAPWFMAWAFRFISWIIATISYFMFRSAFRDLESEQGWSGKAQKGATLLRKSATINIWLQFIPMIVFVIALIVIFGTYQSIINSSYGSDMGIQEYLGLYIFLSAIIGLTCIVLSILQLIFRIWGWSRVMRGESIEIAGENNVTEHIASTNGYCPQCGTSLAQNAKFCQSCGYSIPSTGNRQIVETSQTDELSNKAGGMEEEQYVYEEENPSAWDNYKWYFIGGGAILMIIIVLVCMTIGISPKGSSDEFQTDLTDSIESAIDPYETNSEMTVEEAERYEEVEAAVEDDWDATTSIDWEGTINGKWNIEMTIHRLDGMVWGSYCYTKNKTSISLDGQWGGDNQLTLTERVDGSVTGQFIGTYGESVFEGIWVSADGEKEYPFTLKPVYKVEP